MHIQSADVQFLYSMLRHKQAAPPFLPPSGPVRLLRLYVPLLKSEIRFLVLPHKHKWNTCLKRSASPAYHFPLCNNSLLPPYLICRLAYPKNIPFSHPIEASAGLCGCVFPLSPLIYLYLQAAFSEALLGKSEVPVLALFPGSLPSFIKMFFLKLLTRCHGSSKMNVI